MTEEIKKKIVEVRDLGSFDVSPEHIVYDFEKALEKYFPLKAYDFNDEIKVEYRIISDTDSDLMFFRLGVMSTKFSQYFLDCLYIYIKATRKIKHLSVLDMNCNYIFKIGG